MLCLWNEAKETDEVNHLKEPLISLINTPVSLINLKSSPFSFTLGCWGLQYASFFQDTNTCLRIGLRESSKCTKRCGQVLLIIALHKPVWNWISLKFSYIYLKTYCDKNYALEENLVVENCDKLKFKIGTVYHWRIYHDM